MSKFLKVKCDCGEEALVFGDSKTVILCKKCKNPLVKPRGGRASITCRILEVLS